MTIRTRVDEVLGCFDNEFAAAASAFARGEYLLWLGSGISRSILPDVSMLLKRILEFLRTNTDPADRTCRFRKALEEVLDISGVSTETRQSIDLASPVESWPAVPELVSRLGDRYSDVLDIQVRGESEDFLVWTGLDVPNVYGAPGLQPDIEHLCIAILMLEGVVRSAPSTNWDGLVEAAMGQLVENPGDVLRVIVRPLDFREPDRQAELVKFHGCAVRAAADANEYRSLLIARKSQISGWTAKPENQLMKGHLEMLFASRPAFIVGLSAQDANIHIVLHEASRNLARTWPASPPAVVFAEQELHHHHRHVMRVTYGETYAANAEAIAESALLGAYAQPALLGLVLFTLADKLCTLAGSTTELALPSGEMDRIRSNLRDLRDALGRLADADPHRFIDAVISGVGLTMAVFRTGRAPDPGHIVYHPISTAPISRALTDPDFPCGALGRLAIAMSLLARGMSEGLWSLSLGTPVRPARGVLRLATSRQVSRVFVVRDSRARAQLEIEGLVDPYDDRALVIQTEAATLLKTRSPRARYGRTGKGGLRHIDLEELCSTLCSADDLFEAFRLEGAL